MIISRVESKLDENKFIKFSSNLYKEDKYWIRPLDKDVSNVFKPDIYTKNIEFFSSKKKISNFLN